MLMKTKRKPSVVVIGAGMTGILMTIKLQEAGITDITVLEKKEKVGGTWRENTYPGVACDVPAHMYTYSFAANPEWNHRYARGSEIQTYFEGVADRYGVNERIRFNESVTACNYIDGRWHLETSRGASLEADFVISATGILHHPAYPDIEGLEDFKGEVFHTAEWNHEVELKGRRVGIIGTGSTASQVIPKLAEEVEHLDVFQRTAQWLVPLWDRDYSEDDKQAMRTDRKLVARVRRGYFRLFEETFSKAVVGKKLPHFLMTCLAKYNLWRNVRDPELRAKLRPDYKVGCKRLVFSSAFYPAMQRSNVSLVTEGIQRVTEKGIVTADGREHEMDVLVLSTGFKPFNFMRPMDMHGKNGLSIDEAWGKKVQAYRSVCLPDFPNFFLMLGPNTPIGNYSVIEMSEVQGRYVMQLIQKWREGELETIEASHEATRNYNDYLRAGMKNTVWVGGCQSWYLDADGDPAMWPYTWGQWVKEMELPQMDDFVTEPAVVESPVKAVA
jgi:cation diffusion facilitator CzcD-associated flavoprotein CzcO